MTTLPNHQENGHITALNSNCVNLLSASQGGQICLWKCDPIENIWECVFTHNANSAPRAIDISMGILLYGTRRGEIFKLEVETEGAEPELVVNSHNEGELWGVTYCEGSIFTSGDDGKVFHWIPNTSKGKESKVSTVDRQS